MKTIYKYALKVKGLQEIELPEGYEILDVQMQNGIPCIWALVDTENVPVKMEVHIFATGDRVLLPDLNYIGTVQMLGGQAVFHVFRR